MSQFQKIIIIILSVFFKTFCWIPTFGNGDTLKIQGKPICVNDTLMFPSPELADWDHDGVTDLLLGYWGFHKDASGSINPLYGGRVYFLKNRGTNDNPDFVKKGYLYSTSGVIDLEAA
jgi:hypothetical protein